MARRQLLYRYCTYRPVYVVERVDNNIFSVPQLASSRFLVSQQPAYCVPQKPNLIYSISHSNYMHKFFHAHVSFHGVSGACTPPFQAAGLSLISYETSPLTCLQTAGSSIKPINRHTTCGCFELVIGLHAVWTCRALVGVPTTYVRRNFAFESIY